jgi:hypothetical protein
MFPIVADKILKLLFLKTAYCNLLSIAEGWSLGMGKWEMHYVVSVDVGVKPNQAKPNRFRAPPNWCQVERMDILKKYKMKTECFSVVVPL